MARGAILGAALAFTAAAAPGYAQPVRIPPGFVMPSPNVALTVMPLRGGVYWVAGGVATAGFIVGEAGVIAIDTGFFAQTARNELAAIAKITPKPINMIILTHSDPDHVNGLPAFPRGVEIVAQENAKAEMLQALADPHPGFGHPSAELNNYLPTHTVRDREKLVRDGVRMVLLHTSPAHTDGDLIIYLPTQKIVFAGDLLTPEVGPYPGIHLEKHGSSLGWIASMKAMVALNADTFISGHGEPQTKAQCEARLAAAEQRRARIKALVDQGKSLDEIKQTLNDPPPTGAAALFPTFTDTTYQELTAP